MRIKPAGFQGSVKLSKLVCMCLFTQVLLSNPVLKDPVNLEAARLLKKNYAQYRKRVIECVKASQHLEGNKPPCFMLLVINIFFEHNGEFKKKPFKWLSGKKTPLFYSPQ